ncbi:hypothetical protein D3C83_310950 [compost metagenome]
MSAEAIISFNPSSHTIKPAKAGPARSRSEVAIPTSSAIARLKPPFMLPIWTPSVNSAVPINAFAK